jgi:hypothetical protein
MKKKHSKKKEPRKMSFADCFRPRVGDEFLYLGEATYRPNKKGGLEGKNAILLSFYKKLDRIARPRLCPAFVLRLLLMSELNGSTLARKTRLFLIKGVEVKWMGWRWERFRIRGNFTPKAEALAKETAKEIEDASHAGWFV